MLCIGAASSASPACSTATSPGSVFTGLGLWGEGSSGPTSRSHARRRRSGRRSLTAGAAHPGDQRSVVAARWLASCCPCSLWPSSRSLGRGRERFFRIDGLNLDTACEVRDEVSRRTTTGGSEFAPPNTGTLRSASGGRRHGDRPAVSLGGDAASLLGGGGEGRCWPSSRWRASHMRTAARPRALSQRWPRFVVGLRAGLRLGVLGRQELRHPRPPAIADAPVPVRGGRQCTATRGWLGP